MQRIMLDSALYPKVGNKQEYAYVYMLKLPTCMDGNNPTYKEINAFYVYTPSPHLPFPQ